MAQERFVGGGLDNVTPSTAADGFIVLPKVGADFGERTVIRTFPDGLVILLWWNSTAPH